MPDIELSAGSALIDRFNLLSSSGALDDLAALRRENRELDALVNDASGLFALEDVESMMNFAISRILTRFVPERLVFLAEQPRGDGVAVYAYRYLKPDGEPFPVASYGPVKRYFLSSPYPVAFEDLEARIGPEALGPEIRAYEPRLFFPLRGIRGLFGMAMVGRKIVGEAYSELERMYMDRFTRFLAIGVQNGLHHQTSITDAKTGLYTHDHFLRRLEEELSRGVRQGSGAGILMLDIDRFKLFNDSNGHVAGDGLLQAIARAIKASVRVEDVVARFGGEEFCVLAVDCDEAGLGVTAERIRKRVEATRLVHEGRELSATTSVGCCVLEPGFHWPPSAFIERADRALYQSKKEGRNRYTIYRYGLMERSAAIRAAAGAKERRPGR